MSHRAVLPALLLSVALSACVAETASTDGPAHWERPEGMHVDVIQPLVLTEQARVPEMDPSFESVEVHEDHIVFHLAAQLVEPLEPGHIISGLGNSYEEQAGYLRKVVTVSPLTDGRLEVTTESAALSEFLAEGEFDVQYDPFPDSEAPDLTDLGDGVAGRSDALDTRGGGIVLIGSPTGLRCGGGTATDVTFTPIFTIDPEFEARLKIGISGPRGGWNPLGWRPPAPKVDEFYLKMGASVTVGLDVESEGGWDAVCVMDFYDGAALPDIPLPDVMFWVGPVPVWIQNEIEPIFTVDMDVRVATDSFASHQSATIGLEAGVQYEDGDWSAIWEPEASTSSGVTATDDDGGDVSATFRLSAGLEYQARLYSALGPNFGIEMFVEDEVKALAPEYCEWTEQLDAGVTATFGGELEIGAGPIDWTVAQIQIAEVDLLRFPVDSDAGTFPWCDSCSSSITCEDDLGREICGGGNGVLECGRGSGYFQSCRCTASGLVDCGPCGR